MEFNMNPFIGKSAPDFEAKVVMPDNSIVAEFNLKTIFWGNCLRDKKYARIVQVFIRRKG